MSDLGRRAWRWMPGMRLRARDGLYARVMAVTTAGVLWAEWEVMGDPACCGTKRWQAPDAAAEFSPDFDDPATRGCLLALVREAWGRPGITTKLHRVLGWIVVDGREDFLKSVACDTEAEALVAALEAAP